MAFCFGFLNKEKQEKMSWSSCIMQSKDVLRSKEQKISFIHTSVLNAYSMRLILRNIFLSFGTCLRVRRTNLEKGKTNHFYVDDVMT